jgi:predicted ABC-type sugar transport system permease subunit
MIAKVRAFAAFWYDFIIGDDWRVAVGVSVALAITYGLSRVTGTPIWWIVVAGVALILPVSIQRVVRRKT